MLEKLFAIDRDVRKGRLVRHLTKEKRAELDSDTTKLKDLEYEYKTKNVELTDCKNKTFQKQSLLSKVTEEFHELNSEIIKKESATLIEPKK